MRRRLALGGAFALVVVAMGACGAPENSPARGLERRLASAEAQERYSLEYESAFGDVLDCATGAPQRFSADVDLASGVMEVRTPRRGGGPTVVLVDEAAWVHRSLFAEPVVPADWLVVDGSEPSAARRHLLEVLGPAVGEYSQPGGFAPNGNSVAVSALEVAQTVRSLGVDRIGDVVLDRYEIVVDAERLGALGSTAQPTDGDDVAHQVTPVLDIWVGADGLVHRLTVAGIAVGSSDAETPGWSVDYRYDQAPLKPPTVPDDHVMLADIDVEALRIASAEQCQLGT